MELLTAASLPERIEYYIPPTLLKLHNRRYVIIKGVWYPADESITQAMLYKIWKRPIKKPEVKPSQEHLSLVVKSSTGKGTYTVEYKHDSWSCTCPAFGFRRKCKHIDQVKSKIGK